MGDDFNFNIKTQLKFLGKNWPLIVLVVIMIIGGYYRAYHLDYPVIGYHNWKDAHYLTEARNFERDGFFTHGFFVPEWDFPAITSDPTGAHVETFPTVSIVTAVAFKIFGTNLTVARTLNLIISLLTIAFTYLLFKQMFKREDFALTGALIMALNPLNIFFSHNTQLINYSLLFTFVSGYFFFIWLDKKNYYYLIWSTFFFMMSFITKFSFFVMGIPILLTIPFKKEIKKIKTNIIPIIACVLIIVIISLQLLQTGNMSNEKTKVVTVEGSLQLPKAMFTKNFWLVQKSFLIDNFTIIGGIFALFGAIFLTLKKNKNLGEKFSFYFLLGGIFWFIIMVGKLAGHNYHYYPIIPLMIILITYFIIFVSNTIEKTIRIKNTRWIIILLLAFVMVSPSMEAKNRMFDTQFWGLDIAGDYINTHKVPGDRVIHSSHQAYGLLWHGDLKGTREIPTKLEDIKFAEDELNATWLFIYNWDFAKVSTNRELWTYFANNYRIVQTGFSVNNNQLTGLYYFLFRKGGSFNESLFGPDGNLNVNLFSELVNGKPVQNWQYDRTIDKPIIQYVNIE